MHTCLDTCTPPRSCTLISVDFLHVLTASEDSKSFKIILLICCICSGEDNKSFKINGFIEKRCLKLSLCNKCMCVLYLYYFTRKLTNHTRIGCWHRIKYASRWFIYIWCPHWDYNLLINNEFTSSLPSSLDL